MALIIDAYNVLHCTHILSGDLAMMSVDKLCALLGDSRWTDQRILVVCDGAAPPLADRESGVVELVYVGGGRDADSWIERHIEQTDAPRNLIVVSNDNRIIRAARKRRCKTLGSESFLRQLVSRPTSSSGPAKPTGISPDETEHWLAEFGYDKNTPIPPPPTEHPEEEEQQQQFAPTQNKTVDADEQATADDPPQPDPPKDGTDYWLKKFGFEEEQDD